MKVTVKPQMDIFLEGSLVSLTGQPDVVFLVTVPARGYDDCQEGTFWAINLTGKRISGGNYRKDLFEKFSGTITIEA